MSQLPVPSTRSLSQQTLALRMARKHKAKMYKIIYECLTKGCCPQGASKADKSNLRRSRKISKLLVESISIPKLVQHNSLLHYFYIAIITYILVQYCGHYFSESNWSWTSMLEIIYTHHHSSNLKYLPTLLQQVLVVRKLWPGAVAIAICQFLSTAHHE